jgi:hypothetical protein
MITPPTPLRILIFFILYSLLPGIHNLIDKQNAVNGPNITSQNKFREIREIEDTKNYLLDSIYPYHIPLIGVLHVLLVHFSHIFRTINHNEKNHNGIVLLENSIYYALCQAFILGVCHIFYFFTEEMAWLCTIYFATYYAWFIVKTASTLQHCTSSPTCLKMSMFIYCIATVPYMAYYNFKKNKMSFLSDNVSNNIYLQFIAWISADICAYYHYMLCILYAVINNISNIPITYYE